MENYTPGEIVAFVLCLVLAVAGFINTVGSAMEKIAKAKKAAQAPDEEQNRRLQDLEKRMSAAEKKLANDNTELQVINDGLQAIFQGQLAMLDHCLDGNNVKQMQDAKAVLQHHLITHK